MAVGQVHPGTNTTAGGAQWLWELWCQIGHTRTEALHGWSSIRSSPMTASATYFGSATMFHLFMLVLLAGSYPMPAWHAIAPHSALIVCGLTSSTRIWRMGPNCTKSPLSGVLLLLTSVALSFLGMSLGIGPDNWIPFHNRPLSLVLLAVGGFFVQVTGHCGGVPTLHPPEPYIRMWAPLTQALVETTLIMDTLTDAFMIRFLMQQVQSNLPGPLVHKRMCRDSTSWIRGELGGYGSMQF